MSRKKFIESQGATCRNWNWSWSFINTEKKFVIFGAWDKHSTEAGAVILKEQWEYNSEGRRQPGYSQALEHIGLVESGAYMLKTFRMFYSDERQDEQGQGPAKIARFIPKLEAKMLEKRGDTWLAIG